MYTYTLNELLNQITKFDELHQLEDSCLQEQERMKLTTERLKSQLFEVLLDVQEYYDEGAISKQEYEERQSRLTKIYNNLDKTSSECLKIYDFLKG